MREALNIRPNFLDRLVNYVSPVAGARRMQARWSMQVMGAAAGQMASGLVAGVRPPVRVPGRDAAELEPAPRTAPVRIPGHRQYHAAGRIPGDQRRARGQLRGCAGAQRSGAGPAAASTGQPYEKVSKDFSKTNYSSARAALLEVWKLHTLFQEWDVRGYLDPVWGMVMEAAWLRGMLAVPAGAVPV